MMAWYILAAGVCVSVLTTIFQKIYQRIIALESEVAKLRADHHSIPVPYIPHPVYPTKHPPR